MKIRFWGVRGSIPVPGPGTVRYGGNTTCIEVRTDAGHLIILDAGTGIFQLAQTLMKQMPVQADLLMTHTHWDHIHGMPFFLPIFVPGNRITLHGAYDPVTGNGVEQVMAVQMQYSFFPVRESELRAQIGYQNLMPGQTIQIADATVTPYLLNHPVVDYGYRIECNGKSIFFTGDHEPHYNIYAPGDGSHDEYQTMVEQRRAEVVHCMKGVDLLIADAAYTPQEYQSKRGWGHGTFDSCIELGRAAGARKIALTHHEPTRTDDALEQCFAEACERQNVRADEQIFLTHEGMEIKL